MDKISGIISTVITKLLVITFAYIFFLFLNIGIALMLGEALGKLWYGFGIVALFYGIIMIVVAVFMQKSIKKFFGNFIIRTIYE